MRVFVPPQRAEDSSDLIHDNVDLILEKIYKSKKPLFILGQGVRQGDAINEFRQVIESLDAPFLTSRIAIDVFKTSFKNNLGLAGMKGSRYCQKIMDESDLVLSFGCSMNVAFTNESEKLFPNADVIMVNNDHNEFEKPGLSLNLKVLLDVKIVLEYALSGDFLKSKEKLLDVMLRDSVSGSDIIKSIQKEIWGLAIDPEIKVRLTEKTGEIEFRLTEGSDEFIQLEALLASFVMAGRGV